MITYLDYKRINSLLLRTSLKGKLNDLEKKLHTATIVPSENTPSNLVTMNSEVIVHDITEDKILDFRLVYQFSPLYQNQTSVLAPLGTALLGMKINEEAEFRLRDQSLKRVKLLRIVFQPEANSRFDL